jgi:hypothetical protein
MSNSLRESMILVPIDLVASPALGPADLSEPIIPSVSEAIAVSRPRLLNMFLIDSLKPCPADSTAGVPLSIPSAAPSGILEAVPLIMSTPLSRSYL